MNIKKEENKRRGESRNRFSFFCVQNYQYI